MIALPERFVLFDTEYTSWEGAMGRGWSGEGEHKELVQLGAIIVHRDGFAEESAFMRFVKPVKNPELSDYFTKLTGITQETVNKEGVSLEEAASNFSDYIGALSVFSFGHDIEVVRENCALLGISCPFDGGQFADIRPLLCPLLETRGINLDTYSSGTLITAFAPAPHPAHDAVNDMRNLLAVLREL